MEAKGVQVETYSTEVSHVSANADIASALRVPPNTKIRCLCRVRGWDGRPEVEFRSYFHPRVNLSEDEKFDRPLYELIRETSNLVADESIEKLSAVAADRKLAKVLSVRPGDPLLRRERLVLDTGRKPLELAIVHYRCERFSLTLNLHHGIRTQ
jgi:GntR family transcriptional regulator